MICPVRPGLLSPALRAAAGVLAVLTALWISPALAQVASQYTNNTSTTIYDPANAGGASSSGSSVAGSAPSLAVGGSVALTYEVIVQ